MGDLTASLMDYTMAVQMDCTMVDWTDCATVQLSAVS